MKSALLVFGFIVIALAVSLSYWFSRPHLVLATLPASLSSPVVPHARTVLSNDQKLLPSRSDATIELYAAPPTSDLNFLLGKLGNGSYATREAALHLLSNELSPVEVRSLLDFLGDPASLSGMRLMNAAALKNDVINLLRNQNKPAGQLTSTLVEISEDPSQPLIMQDYALQHLGAWANDGATPEERKQIAQALQRAALSQQGSVPGTSLLALERLSNSDPKQMDALQKIALQQVQSPQSNPLTLATALQVCAHLHLPAAAVTATQLAQSSTATIPVRISAIAALGELGDQQSISLLEGWAKGDEPRLKIPAVAALQRLNQRLGL